jgi:hypothetical protein
MTATEANAFLSAAWAAQAIIGACVFFGYLVQHRHYLNLHRLRFHLAGALALVFLGDAVTRLAATIYWSRPDPEIMRLIVNNWAWMLAFGQGCGLVGALVAIRAVTYETYGESVFVASCCGSLLFGGYIHG